MVFQKKREAFFTESLRDGQTRAFDDGNARFAFCLEKDEPAPAEPFQL